MRNKNYSNYYLFIYCFFKPVLNRTNLFPRESTTAGRITLLFPSKLWVCDFSFLQKLRVEVLRVFYRYQLLNLIPYYSPWARSLLNGWTTRVSYNTPTLPIPGTCGLTYTYAVHEFRAKKVRIFFRYHFVSFRCFGSVWSMAWVIANLGKIYVCKNPDKI